MGWWKIRSVDSGGIDWDWKKGNRLVNAIPGSDSPDFYYNGDGPADILGLAVRRIEVEFAEELKLKPTREDFVYLFLDFPAFIGSVINHCEEEGASLMCGRYDGEFPPFTKHKKTHVVEKISNLAMKALFDLTKEYQRTWNRGPYPEEIQGALNFVLGSDY